MKGTGWTARILECKGSVCAHAAREFAAAAERAVLAKGVFSVALSGGSTPRGMYERLCDVNEPYRESVPWEAIRFFFCDERHVGPCHPDSNYRLARDLLLSSVPAREENIFRIKAENPAAELAAQDYQCTLKAAFQCERDEVPRFDLILLGMGADGHTASIFPGSDAVNEKSRWVLAPWIEKLERYRITLTPPILNNAARAVFLVTGKDKAQAVRDVFKVEGDPRRCPARIIRPVEGSVLWLIDEAAAALLPNRGEALRNSG